MTSPRPWKRNDNTINAADGSLVAVLGTTVGDAPWAVRARHDGDLIVHRVNSYDDLVAAAAYVVHPFTWAAAGYCRLCGGSYEDSPDDCEHVGGCPVSRLATALADHRQAVSA